MDTVNRSTEAERLDQCRQLVDLIYARSECNNLESLHSIIETVRALATVEAGMHSLLMTGCPRALLVLLVRMALIQAFQGGSDLQRDRITTMAADILFTFIDKDQTLQQQNPDESAATIASLLGCTGWHLGQEIGCVLSALLLKGKCSVSLSVLPQLEKLMITPSTHQVQLAARTALSILVFYGDPEKSKQKLASRLSNSALLELMADPPPGDGDQEDFLPSSLREDVQ